MDNFLEKFLILLVKQFFGALMNSCSLECATMFPIRNKFSHNIWLTSYFDFLFWFSSAILLSEMNSLFLNLYASPQLPRHYLDSRLPREACTNLQIQRFSLIKFWCIIWMCGFSDFQSNNIEKPFSHKYLFFLKLLE